jgi:hypothetical protein
MFKVKKRNISIYLKNSNNKVTTQESKTIMSLILITDLYKFITRFPTSTLRRLTKMMGVTIVEGRQFIEIICGKLGKRNILRFGL